MCLTIKGSVDGHKKLADKVLASLKRHAEWMGMSTWIFVVTFTDDTDTPMQTSAEPEYYTARIDVNLERLGESDVDEYVRHELMHALLWLYTNLAEELSIKKGKRAIRKMEERIISDLERMPLWDELYGRKK